MTSEQALPVNNELFLVSNAVDVQRFDCIYKNKDKGHKSFTVKLIFVTNELLEKVVGSNLPSLNFKKKLCQSNTRINFEARILVH
jgi:hypothetical protein